MTKNEEQGVYVSWNGNGYPVLTKESFGRDSRWFANQESAQAMIDAYHRDRHYEEMAEDE